MRVLISAYACNPYAGSEPGVGFETVMAVAAHHETWVITRNKNSAAISAYLADRALDAPIHVVPLDLSPRALWIKARFGGLGLQWYYDRWQRTAADLAAELTETVGFDVVHHVTFSADWSRAGVMELNLPSVWGPIGGGVTTPFRLLRILGLKGIGAELARAIARRLMRRRRWYRESWRKAGVVLVQNMETASVGPGSKNVRLLPNSTAVSVPAFAQTDGGRTSEILVVGRLIPWKAGMLALAAFKRVASPGAILTFLGTGPEEGRLRRAVIRWGLSERVTFEGSIARDVLLERISRAGAVLHPAVHEENSMAVGEALALGTPVVCIDRGGPPELLRQWNLSPGTAVAVGWPGATAARLATELDRFLTDPPPIPPAPLQPVTSYAQAVLSSYEEAAAGNHSLPGSQPDHPGM
jgi:glycosyltransferase involved in cell wall biosynthesis